MSITKTVVISSAGIGSRLGLGCSKSLIEIEGKPLIHWQLEMLEDVEDVRIVVGYEAQNVIKTVLKKRKKVLFIFNHNYFITKTLYSLYLGAKYSSNNTILALDGDLIIHPDDMRLCLLEEDPFIGYSEIISQEPVKLSLDNNNNVIDFSRIIGSHEWIGPAAFKANSLKNFEGINNSHVYEYLKNFLPIKGLKVRAMDIDTPEDYSIAKSKILEWF